MLHRLLVGIGLGIALLAAQSFSVANVPADDVASMLGKPAPAFELDQTVVATALLERRLGTSP